MLLARTINVISPVVPMGDGLCPLFSLVWGVDVFFWVEINRYMML